MYVIVLLHTLLSDFPVPIGTAMISLPYAAIARISIDSEKKKKMQTNNIELATNLFA